MEATRTKKTWIQWIVPIAVAVIIAATAAAWLLRGKIQETVRQDAVAGLEQAFAGRLEWKSFEVNLLPRLQVTAEGLVLHFQGQNDLPPLIYARKLSATSRSE